MEDGLISVDSFFDDWFIRKCLWASAYSIKTTAASIKKLYECMTEKGFVAKKDYDILCEELKENMDSYLKSYA